MNKSILILLLAIALVMMSAETDAWHRRRRYWNERKQDFLEDRAMDAEHEGDEFEELELNSQ
uniref:Uncharacterized protein n=1 Tax=Ciona savignyi TaxID=51511 RepID=H2YU82_CIOSA